jgi:hypothetical protein
MREFSVEHAYAVAPPVLQQLWRDHAFLSEVGRRFGGVGEPTVTEDGEDVVVRSQRQLPLDKLPGFLHRFVGSGALEQRDVWPREIAAPDEKVEGRWSVSGEGMPAEMSGTQLVEPTSTGCVVRVQGQVKVHARLIAGRAEAIVVQQITKLIGRQQEFAQEWLAKQSSPPPAA